MDLEGGGLEKRKDTIYTGNYQIISCVLMLVLD